MALAEVRSSTEKWDAMSPEEQSDLRKSVKTLDLVAREKLLANLQDADKLPNAPARIHKYEAAFQVGDDSVALVSSIGHPSVRPDSPLFVSMHTNIDGQVQKTAGLELEATNAPWWVSRYSSAQIDSVSVRLQGANSIPKTEYAAFMGASSPREPGQLSAGAAPTPLKR